MTALLKPPGSGYASNCDLQREYWFIKLSDIKSKKVYTGICPTCIDSLSQQLTDKKHCLQLGFVQLRQVEAIIGSGYPSLGSGGRNSAGE